MSGGGGSTTIKDTPAQKSLARIAAQRFNLYQQYFVPLENQFIADVQSLKDPSNFENVASFVNTIQQPEFQEQRRQLAQQAFQQGVDPTSGQYRGRTQQLSQAQARGLGIGTAEGMSGLGDVGKIAQQRAQAEAKTSFAKAQTVPAAIGTGVGLGVGYTLGGFGNNSGGGG